MEDFRHVYMIIDPTFPTFDGFFWWLRVWDDIILHESFGLIGWWWHCLHLLPNPLDCMVIVFLSLVMLLDGILTFESFGLTTCLQGTSKLVHPSRIFPPLEGWLFLTILIVFFSWGSCLMMFIMSLPILLWSFKLIPYLLVGFWRLWLLNYPFSFSLTFPSLNPMDWHETKGVPSLGVLIIKIQYFNSIWWGNPKMLAFHYGYWNWSLMGERVNGPIMNIRYFNQYLSNSWDTLFLHACILTQNFYPFSLICAIFLWRLREELGWESTNTKFSTKMDLTTFEG